MRNWNDIDRGILDPHLWTFVANLWGIETHFIEAVWEAKKGL